MTTPTPPFLGAHALVVGASGITGALVEKLTAGCWEVGREIEVLADMSRSRLLGFTGYVRTEDSFTRLFDRYRSDRVIP